jgi:hypothetical protein
MLDNPPFAKRQAPGATQQSQPQPMEETDPEVTEVAATPDEEAQREKVMRHAYSVMADEKAFPELQKMIEADPLNAIADATVTIIERVEQDMGEQDPDILEDVASEIIPNLAELAKQQTGVDIPEDQQEQALAVAIGKWAKAHPERVDQDGLQKMGEASSQALGIAQGSPEQTPAAPPAGAAQ